MGDKKPQGDAQPSTSRSADDKFDLMMKAMDKLMEIMFVGNRPTAREQHDPQPKNQNLRRVQVPQIRQREQREQGDQQTRPLFQNNYVDENFDQMFKDQTHYCDNKNPRLFLTKGEHDQYMRKNDDMMLETDDTLSQETKEFRKGYHNAIMQFQKKYNLRIKEVPTEPR
jgi:hypothetical protein